MNKYEKAAMLFGEKGAAGESDAIAKYLLFISAIEDVKNKTPEDLQVIKNVLERIADEINHLLGNTLDAIKIAGLKIAIDDIDEIFEDLRRVVDDNDGNIVIFSKDSFVHQVNL